MLDVSLVLLLNLLDGDLLRAEGPGEHGALGPGAQPAEVLDLFKCDLPVISWNINMESFMEIVIAASWSRIRRTPKVSKVTRDGVGISNPGDNQRSEARTVGGRDRSQPAERDNPLIFAEHYDICMVRFNLLQSALSNFTRLGDSIIEWLSSAVNIHEHKSNTWIRILPSRHEMSFINIYSPSYGWLLSYRT